MSYKEGGEREKDFCQRSGSLNILITGVTGFVGSALADSLALNSQFQIRGTSRQKYGLRPDSLEIQRVGELGPDTEWKWATAGIDVVIHTAARVHVMNERAKNPLADFMKVNVLGTRALALKAVEAGVRRFVFISSVKVNGEATPIGRPFREDMHPVPEGPYAVSKHEAEKVLFDIGIKSGMEIVVIRPPLIYGPGVKANFATMMNWLAKGIPLPLGAIHNRRSFVAIDNLIDLITTCIDHPKAANQVFFAGDGEDLSTTELLIRLSKSLNRPVCLIPVSEKILKTGFKMIGREDMSRRLCSSLQIDLNKVSNLIGWHPTVNSRDALKKTMCSFMESI
nr:SDR family oxidoreductase [uncultured Desulfobacter sp.]